MPKIRQTSRSYWRESTRRERQFQTLYERIHTNGKVMLIKLNRLWNRWEICCRPPPGGPMAARRCMSFPIGSNESIVWRDNDCLAYFDVFHSLSFSIVPESVINPSAPSAVDKIVSWRSRISSGWNLHQFQGRLKAIGILRVDSNFAVRCVNLTFAGMFISSMNAIIFFPLIGTNTFFARFSRLDSKISCSIFDVV